MARAFAEDPSRYLLEVEDADLPAVEALLADVPHGVVGSFVTGGPDAAGEVMGHLERSPTAWRPYLWPIKTIMIFGFVCMLLQAISEFLKDVATLRGVAL